MYFGQSIKKGCWDGAQLLPPVFFWEQESRGLLSLPARLERWALLVNYIVVFRDKMRNAFLVGCRSVWSSNLQFHTSHLRPEAMVRGVLWWRPRSSKGRRCSSTSPTPRSLGRRRQHPGGRAATLWGEEKDPKIILCDMIHHGWRVNSIIRSAGMSKAVFSLQRSIRFQRAVFFALINPQVAALTHCQILPSYNQHVCNSNLIFQV